MLTSGHSFSQSPMLAFTFCTPMNVSQLPKPHVNVLLSFSHRYPSSHTAPTPSYLRAVSTASQHVLFVYFFFNYHVFSSPCSQTPSINKQTHAAWLVYAAEGVKSTEGQEEESGRGVSAVPRREAREEKGQLEGVGLAVIFKNMRRSSYLAS